MEEHSVYFYHQLLIKNFIDDIELIIIIYTQ